jgi:hypothetical protein
VIWESRFWKADLLRFAEQLRCARTGTKPFSDAMYVTVEKAVLIGAFVIRRLADSNKLSDATAAMELRTRRFPSTGNGATLINNHRVDELFDFARASPSRQPLLFLCNQAIHSYVLTPYVDRGGGRDGFFLHGGRRFGSLGCIDVGGGKYGDARTNQLLLDLLADPDGIVPLAVVRD